jgi:hypothetical protein
MVILMIFIDFIAAGSESGSRNKKPEYSGSLGIRIQIVIRNTVKKYN